MEKLSIITALGRAEYHYLQAAADSIKPIAQTWETQWVIACDSVEAAEVEENTQAFGLNILVVPSPSNSHTSAGATRNRALAHVDSTYTLTLDSDDFYYPKTMTNLIEHTIENGLAFGAGLACDVNVAGHKIAAPPLSKLHTGVQEHNCYFEHWEETGYWPWHPSSTLVQTALLHWIGGWEEDGPLRDDEDVFLWSNINRRATGFFTTDTVMAYRKHPQSLTVQPHYNAYQIPFETVWAQREN